MDGDKKVSLWVPCANREELSAWVKEFAHLEMPRQPVCPNHQTPLDYLAHAYFEPASDVVVWAPRGGGKTQLAAVATLLDLLHKPRCAVRILGGSGEQSLRMWDYLLPLLEEHAADQLIQKRLGKVRLKNGSNAAALTQSQRAVRGQRVQKMRCDEVELFDPEVWKAAQLVTRSLSPRHPDTPHSVTPPISGTIEALSTHQKPWGLMHQVLQRAADHNIRIIKWCLLDVLEKCPKDRECAHCVLYEDCRKVAKDKCDGFFHIDDAIAMKHRVSIETWNNEMLCLKPSADGSVFPTFNPEIHVRETIHVATQIQNPLFWPAQRESAIPNESPPPRLRGESPIQNPNFDHPTPLSDSRCASVSPCLRGESSIQNPKSEIQNVTLALDFGFSDPFVCLWIAQLADGSVHVFDEYIQPQRIVEEHLQVIESRPWGQIRDIACDPSGAGRNDQTAESNIALLKRKGYRVHHRSSHIVDGIELIRRALHPAAGHPTLFIHPRCPRLIRALQSYHYPPNGGELPLKDGTHDHLIDALRYFFINRDKGGKLITRCY